MQRKIRTATTKKMTQRNNTANLKKKLGIEVGDLPTQNYPIRSPAQKQMTDWSQQNQKIKYQDDFNNSWLSIKYKWIELSLNWLSFSFKNMP